MVGWCVAVWSALTVVRMSPSGDKFANYIRLSFWRFGELESRLGLDVQPVLKRFAYGFAAFFAFVLAAVLTGFVGLGLTS